jgi:polar amino acid transport system substrate-binding protein
VRAPASVRSAIRRRAAAVSGAFVLAAVVPASAQAPPVLRVLVHAEPPFVIRQGDRWSGWAIDLWAEVARQTGLQWTIVGEAAPAEIVDALVGGRADVGVGDISVTKSRDEVIDFSHPFFRSGLRILTRSRSDSLWTAIESLATRAHVGLALGVLALLGGMSALVYVLARRHDPGNFPSTRREGIVEAVYIAATALLKGQLDRRLLPGIAARILTIVWMFFGTAVVAYLTAEVAAVLTVQRLNTDIQSLGDLAGRQVAAVSGTFIPAWLRERGIDVVERPDIDAAVGTLLARQVDAVVHDAPVLIWWTTQHPSAPLLLVGRMFERNDYAFAVPEQSPLRVTVNLALLDLQETGFFAELDRRWLEPPR